MAGEIAHPSLIARNEVWGRTRTYHTYVQRQPTAFCRLPQLFPRKFLLLIVFSFFYFEPALRMLDVPHSPPPLTAFTPPPRARSPSPCTPPLKTVARVCGSVRIALNVCEVALVERLRELGHDASVAEQQPRDASAVTAAASSKGSGGGAAGVLLTVAGAKAALNSYLQSAGAVAVAAEVVGGEG